MPLNLGALGQALRPRPIRGGRGRALIKALAARLIVTRLTGAHQIDRAVGHDAVEPGPEVGARLESAQLPVRPKEALLHNILSILLAAGHSKREAKDTLAVTLDERAKRLAVALAGPRQDGCCLARVHLLRLDGVGRAG